MRSETRPEQETHVRQEMDRETEDRPEWGTVRGRYQPWDLSYSLDTNTRIPKNVDPIPTRYRYEKRVDTPYEDRVEQPKAIGREWV